MFFDLIPVPSPSQGEGSSLISNGYVSEFSSLRRRRQRRSRWIKFNSLLVLLIVVSISCSKREKFDKDKWDYKVDIIYENREAMVHDLITNYKLVGLTFYELVELLGSPENVAAVDSNKVYCTIIEEYGWNIDPIRVEYLVFEMNEDSIVTAFEIEKIDSMN